MSKESKSVDGRFSFMALLCSFFVVLIHCNHCVENGSLSWWAWQMVSEGMCRIAVPFFFVASGFYLAKHVDEPGWWTVAVCKRFRTLVVPYFLWLMIAAVLSGIWKERSLMRILSFWGLNLFEPPRLVQFWYIRSLLLLVFVSPLLIWFVRNKRFAVWFFLAVFLLYGILSPVSGWGFTGRMYAFFRWMFSLEGLFYFSVGIFMRIHNHLLTGERGVAIVLLVLSCGLFALRSWAYLNGFQSTHLITWLTIPLCTYSVWNLSPVCGLPLPLRGVSFPIYVLHKSILPRVEHVLYGNGGGGYAVFGAAVTFLLSFLITRSLKRALPRLSVVLFGSR